MARIDGTTEPWSRNLLHTFGELTAHLRDVEQRLRTATDRAPLLDAYLTVCALSQVLDDFVHRGFLALIATLDVAVAHPEKINRSLDFLPARVALRLRAAIEHGSVRWLARMIDGAVAVRVRLRAATRERALLSTAQAMHRAVHELASTYVRPRPQASDAAAARRLLRELRRTIDRVPPRLAGRVMKIPSCFKDFDIHPEDCQRLIERFVSARPAPPTAITVVGIRTSGSYLAPLCAAALRELGYGDVLVATVRPKVPLFRAERRLLERRGRAGTVLVVDDPTVSGGSVANVIAMLHALGIPASNVVALVLDEPGSGFARDMERA